MIPDAVEYDEEVIIDDNDEHIVCLVEVAANSMPIIVHTEYQLVDERLTQSADEDLKWLKFIREKS